MTCACESHVTPLQTCCDCAALLLRYCGRAVFALLVATITGSFMCFSSYVASCIAVADNLCMVWSKMRRVVQPNIQVTFLRA